MSILSDNLYLDNIEEYVQDENRIVTYKWLSRTLSVPITAAKKMLYAYVQRCRSSAESDACSLSIMYIVTGESNNGNSLLVSLVDEEELPESKSRFSTIWSIHIYSVQKSIPKDSCLLYNTDYQCIKDHITTYSKWNTIDCPAAEVLRSNQHGYYKDNPSTTTTESRGMLTTVTNTISSQTKQNKKKPLVKVSVSSFFNQSQQTTTTTSIKKVEPNIKKKTGFFSTISSKKPSERPSLIKTSELATSGNSRQSLSTEANEEMIIKKKEMLSTEQEDRNDVNNDTKKSAESLNKFSRTLLHDSDLEGEDESIEDKAHPVEEKAIKIKRRRPASSGSKSKTKVEIQTKKKRKRIQNLSSDESDSEQVVSSSKDKMGTTTNKSVTTDLAGLSKNGQKRRKRVKRLVSKMFVEEDGSMVTEKHWEDVSTDASSDEDKIERSEMSFPLTKSSKTESPSKKGTKQSSLMSFFKK